MKTTSNYQDLIKLLALLSMMVDHIGLYIFPEIVALRVVGRYAMPIFCFFAGYNFKFKPKISILIYGVLLYFFSVSLIFESYIETNILIPIFLGQVYIWLFQKQLQSFWLAYAHVVILASLWSFTHTYIDYGSLVIAIMILGNMSRNGPEALNLVAAITSFLSLLHSVIVFYNFQTLHIVLATIVALIVYISITLPKFTQKIGYNVRFLTRHTMALYCFQFVIIESYWKYYLIA